MNEHLPPPLPPSESSPVASPTPPSARRRLAIKLLTMAAVIVILQVPLWLIDSKRAERAERHAAAVSEITAAWGGAQRLVGPVLTVPARRSDGTGAEVWLRLAPDQLAVTGELVPRELRRGIHRAQVYAAELHLAGSFSWPEVWRDERFTVDWSRAEWWCGFSQASGLQLVEPLEWAGETMTIAGGTGTEVWPAGVRAPVPLSGAESAWAFSVAVRLNGSGVFELSPLARTTTLSLRSAATAPSFNGSRLPVTRVLSEDGFEAGWEVGPLGHDTQPFWIGGTAADWQVEERLKAAAFGVTLLPGVTDYRSVERAVTYGILFLVTVYAGYFLAEMLGGRSLHLLNYLLVGAALCLFFLALLALAELTGFGPAYLAAALATTGLIVSYSRAVLGGLRQTAAMAALLGGIFGYLYLVLRLEDLSLVSGTVLLFGLLGAVMYATRHLEFDETAALSSSV